MILGLLNPIETFNISILPSSVKIKKKNFTNYNINIYIYIYIFFLIIEIHMRYSANVVRKFREGIFIFQQRAKETEI